MISEKDMEFPIKKPFRWTKRLRNLIEKEMKGKKLRINELLRKWSKSSRGEIVSLEGIIKKVKHTKNYKREVIPDNMYYNKFVKKGFSLEKFSSFKEAGKAWMKVRDRKEELDLELKK